MSDKETVIINLKSCLLSVKSGVPLNQLESDYFKLNGERIPYRNLGFSSLEDFLNDSGKFTILNFGGVKTVQAKATEKTQHLTDLIKRQKSKPPKKKSFPKKIGFRKFIAPSSFSSRPSNYTRPSSNHVPGSNSYQRSSNSNYSSGLKKPTSYNNRPTQYNSYQPKINNQNKPQPSVNNLNTNSNIYLDSHQLNTDNNSHETKPQPSLKNVNSNINRDRHQLNSDSNLHETKALNAISENSVKNTNDKSVPITNGTQHSLSVNGNSFSRPKHVNSCDNSCNGFESNSSNLTNNLRLPLASVNSLHKFQVGNVVNNNIPQNMMNSRGDKVPKSKFSVQEKCEFKPLIQEHAPVTNIPFQNMPLKSCNAQSRLNKYPKKCEESSNKVNGTENLKERHALSSSEGSSNTKDLGHCVDCFMEIVVDDKDYIEELETYLKNLNLPEPFYEFMVKKEKSDKTIKLTHICVIKVNEKNVSSSFPVECSTVDYAKKVAAKHALSFLKKQYGENVIYPITSDINTMALRIKEFLKLESEENGLMSEVLERMYREKFQENLPVNWVPLLEVFSYFSFDKISNKIIIYLNEPTNHTNGQSVENGCLETSVQEENIIPGTPLKFEDYEEKSVLVSANYGSTSVWVRFVGQNADQNFIEMQAKFNNIMNTTGFNIAEQVTEGEFYAILYNNSWHRVQISGPPDEEDDTVVCFMVDTGEQLNISKDQFCILEPVFMKTKTQALECTLTQFDNFGVFDGLKELLDEMILNKTFFLIPDIIEEGYAGVTLYEKGEGSDRINVNELIIQRLLEKTIARLPSFEENAVVDGNVSAIVETGHLFLQLKFDVVSSLEEILPTEEYLLPEHFLKNKEDVDKDHVYITKYYDGDEGSWCRAQVLEIVDDIEVKIIFIDYGNHAKCKITDLANLELFDPLMAKIPPQAIKVSMNLIPPNIMNTEIAEKIFALIGNDKVLVNLINAPTNNVPCIQLYKIQPDSPEDTICINVKLSQSLRRQ